MRGVGRLGLLCAAALLRVAGAGEHSETCASAFDVVFPSQPLGIKFRAHLGNLVVKDKGKRDDLEVGDTVAAVNGEFVEYFTAKRIAKAIKQAAFPLAITFAREPTYHARLPPALNRSTTNFVELVEPNLIVVESRSTPGRNFAQHVTYKPKCGGMGDSFTGAVTAFLSALLSGRSFSLSWPEAKQVFSNENEVFSAVTPTQTPGVVAVTSNQMIDMCGIEFTGTTDAGRMTEFFRQHRGPDHIVNLRESGTWQWLGWKSLPVNEIFKDGKHIIFHGNRGMVHAAFENELYNSVLKEDLGLEKLSAYGTLFRFLFQPKKTIFDAFSTDFLSAMADQNTIKIGLHIRAVFDLRDGDFGTEETQSALDTYKAFFDCAAGIEARILTETPSAVIKWVLFSDSKVLRLAAREKFGASKVLSADVSLQNSRRDHTGSKKKGPSLAIAAAEHHLLSRCHWTVTSPSSGFSKTATFASLAEDSNGNKANQHFSIQTHVVDQGTGPLEQCQPVNFVEQAKLWAHI